MPSTFFQADFLPSAITYLISFFALFLGSITDLKTREVPDWLNYGLVFSGFGLSLLFSVIYSNSSFIINSIIGFLIFFAIAYIMFYAGQWGGGDSKMIMGLGAMIGIDVSSFSSQFLFAFLVNALLVGALYGLLWSVFLVFKNKKIFSRELNKILMGKNIVKAKKIMLAVLIVLFALLFLIKIDYIKIMILTLAFVMLITFYLWIFIKAIEKSCMYKLVEPSKLTEGDWIVKDIYVGGKYITGPKDLGISKKQIKQLVEFYKKKKIKKIIIKEGIPFVPSFLIAFIVSFMFGNPLGWLI